MDEILRSPIQDPNINTIILYSTPANKVAAFKLNAENPISQSNSGSDLFQGNLDLDNNRGDGSSTFDIIFQLKTIGGRISGALALYIKA